jgi:hypothetical protein
MVRASPCISSAYPTKFCALKKDRSTPHSIAWSRSDGSPPNDTEGLFLLGWLLDTWQLFARCQLLFLRRLNLCSTLSNCRVWRLLFCPARQHSLASLLAPLFGGQPCPAGLPALGLDGAEVLSHCQLFFSHIRVVYEQQHVSPNINDPAEINCRAVRRLE